jgi:hypothetical protein
MTQLILKCAAASRPSGEWSDDDFDVLADGIVVGRIFKANSISLYCCFSVGGVSTGGWAAGAAVIASRRPRRDSSDAFMKSACSVTSARLRPPHARRNPVAA